MILLTMPSFGFLSSVRIRTERATSLTFSKDEQNLLLDKIGRVFNETMSAKYTEIEDRLNQTINGINRTLSNQLTELRDVVINEVDATVKREVNASTALLAEEIRELGKLRSDILVN